MAYVEQTATPDVTPTFVGSVEFAQERTSIALSRVAQLADRLCGPQPSEAAGSKLASVPGGHFDDVMERAKRITNMADAILDQCNRIERSLP